MKAPLLDSSNTNNKYTTKSGPANGNGNATNGTGSSKSQPVTGAAAAKQPKTGTLPAQLVQSIRDGLEPFVNPGAVVELRIPKTNNSGVVSGYFDDLDLLARTAVLWNGRVPGVYMTVNELEPGLLQRSPNRLTKYAKVTTKDADIVKLTSLFIDIDVVGNQGESSTDQQHDAALQCADKIQDFLRSRGWPELIKVDSGNGAHLRGKIDLPNTPAAAALLKSDLEALSLMFGDGEIAVDTSTANPSRTCKIYGTLAAKGKNTPDRPHRFSKILQVPNPLVIIERNQLEDLAAMLPK